MASAGANTDPMNTMWAPWRAGYILAHDKPAGCIFCTHPAEHEDARHYILERRQHAFVILNRYPYNNGHLMVVPFRHVSSLADLSADELREVFEGVRDWTEVLKSRMNPQGFNVGLNLGAVAGAGIADHLHVHVVPRWGGDTNFMPVLGDTRVLPQSLDETYALLTASSPS